ncbi:MAG: 4Fe-4S binding protein [Desulfobacterium sp.]|nr:4Fe-4S binding protein [Desulfobacterium sp.]
MNVIQSLINKAFVNSEKATIIPIHRLQNVRNEIDQFKHNEKLNGFQKWIVDDLYTFDVPNVGFSVKSIILIAIPHPLYANVEFVYGDRTYNFLSPVMSDFENTENDLKKGLSSLKYQVAAASKIPLKRLAVQSGLAVYGKNNISYIDEMGSNFSFVGYYSDIPCDDAYWTDVTMASECTNCNACLNNCPTQAIQKGRFLIDNERCLSYLNESGEPFPDWLPNTVHHCVYDCLKCQIVCPMNKEQKNNVVGPIRFTESETNNLISGVGFEDDSDSFQKKAKYLGFHQWPDGIAKNIKVLIEVGNQENILTS